MKLKIYAVEDFRTIVFRDSIEIETDDYPELKGMSREEVEEYIRENATEMAPTFKGIHESLFDECADAYPVNEKVPSSETSIEFED